MSDDIPKLSVARFEKNTDPSAHDPVAALEAALEWVKSMPEKPTHIIVITGRDSEGESGSCTRFFQAGSYRHHAQQGLCLEAMRLMRES